jgi:hypothetical protein
VLSALADASTENRGEGFAPGMFDDDAVSVNSSGPASSGVNRASAGISGWLIAFRSGLAV